MGIRDSHHGLPVEAFAFGGQHLADEVNQAVAGGLRPGQRAAEGETLAREHAGVNACEPLIPVSYTHLIVRSQWKEALSMRSIEGLVKIVCEGEACAEM